MSLAPRAHQDEAADTHVPRKRIEVIPDEEEDMYVCLRESAVSPAYVRACVLHADAPAPPLSAELKRRDGSSKHMTS